MKISIIIPVYNAERYLFRCLDSVLAIKSVDWECILVDDGSTDHSLDIIRQYIDGTDRFILLKQKNGGVSSARNKGLRVCSGSRIMFMDADDYLFPVADSLILEAVTNHADCDIVLFRWADVFSNGVKKIVEVPEVNTNDKEEWIKETVLFRYNMNSCWSKLFKKSIITEYNICFDTTMRVAEDSCFVANYLQYVHSIVILHDDVLYAYCQNDNSAMRKVNEKDIFDEFRAYEKRLELAMKRKVSISEQDRCVINNLFFNDIIKNMSKYIMHYSRNDFKNIAENILNDKDITELIHNSDTSLDSPKSKFIKHLIRNKRLNTYWWLIRFKNILSLKV